MAHAVRKNTDANVAGEISTIDRPTNVCHAMAAQAVTQAIPVKCTHFRVSASLAPDQVRSSAMTGIAWSP